MGRGGAWPDAAPRHVPRVGPLLPSRVNSTCRPACCGSRQGGSHVGNQEFRFVDRTGASVEPPVIGGPVVIPREALDAEVERLAGLPPPVNGRRQSQIV